MFCIIFFAVFQLSIGQSTEVRYHDKTFYFQNGLIISRADVCSIGDLTPEQAEACFTMQDDYRTLHRVRNTMLISGAVTLLGFYVRNQRSEGSGKIGDEIFGIALLVGGGGVFVTTLLNLMPRDMRRRKSLRRFISSFNETPHEDNSMELKLGTTSSGIGLVLNF